MEKKDWCTKFPDNWYQWYLYKGFIPLWRKVCIGDICEDHDDIDDARGGCDSTAFAKGLIKRKVVAGVAIFTFASIACWVKYPFKMMKRV